MSKAPLHMLRNQIEARFPFTKGMIWTKNEIGHSDASVFMLKRENEPVFVLKKQTCSPVINLAREVAILEWLAGKLPVPEAMGYYQENGEEYMLMRFVEGEMSYVWGRGREKELGTLLGEVLQQIHQVSIAATPFPANKSSLEWQVRGFPGQEPKWDPVWSHGDFCLPNILIANGSLSGLIDLAHAGVHDRYHDLYWAEWSLQYNNLAAAIPYLWESYGIPRDPEKMDVMKSL
ncbi:MAG: phosphotransferase [Bacteroidota bacterium]